MLLITIIITLYFSTSNHLHLKCIVLYTTIELIFYYNILMRHIWQQTLPHISHNWSVYTIHDVRDYHWETDNAAKQQFTSITFNLWKITTCRLYQSAFWFGHIIAHYMIWFSYINHEWYEDEIVLSIEARRPAWEEYTLRKGIIPWMYSIIYTRWTPRDILSLRKHVWHDPLVSYELELSAKKCQDLFTYFAHRTNSIIYHQLSYHAIWYNCLTDLHRWLSSVTKTLFSITPWTVMAKWYIWYLKRHKLIK